MSILVPLKLKLNLTLSEISFSQELKKNVRSFSKTDYQFELLQ